MSLTVPPFAVQLPTGYIVSLDTSGARNASSGAAEAKSTTPNGPVDVIRIGNTWDAGSFTAAEGDAYRLSGLFHGRTSASATVAGYRLALGDGGGQLLLDGTDVTDRTSFTADEFSHLTYTAGATGSQQSIVVMAQTGTRLANGALVRVSDSPSVQITAAITGKRSIDALGALTTIPTGTDSDVIGVVKEAAILTGLGGSARPSLTTAGNFTAAAGDIFRLSALFHGKSGTSAPLAGYRVALGDGGGQLLLDGTDVTGRTSFTADEFSHLTYTAGAAGSQQDIVVAAQTGTQLANGSLTRVTDSKAVQISADVSGSRSLNGMAALTTISTGTDSDIISLVKEAAILTGLGGSARPTLTTSGSFSAAAGDVYRLSALFQGKSGTSAAIAGYRVALGDGGGQLLLDGTDVTSRTSFTADEFSHLTYTAGMSGSGQDIVVAAQTGTRLANGSLTRIIDSPAMQISADVNGSRSINGMGALTTISTGSDSNIISVVKEAAILSGLGGSARPGLQTVGNFTSMAGDIFRLSALFQGKSGTSGSLAGYRVALGDGGGQLLLDGTDVTSRTSFTADEFSHLTYTAGMSGSQQDIVVAAQTGTRLANGSLTRIIDSPAMQITAGVSGSRSLNGMAALTTISTGTDSNIISVVKEAAILTGLGTATRPVLQTVGNFAAAAGDEFRLNGLFQGTAPAGKSIAGYRVALGDGGGQLLLDGTDVTDRTSFTALEFSHLTYTAGAAGSQQNIVVVAQLGSRLSNGILTRVTDGSAVQITAHVTGNRSINALSGLTTTPTGTDSDIVSLVKEASIFTGLGTTARPSLQTILSLRSALSLTALSMATGAFDMAGSTGASAPIDLSSFDPGSVASSASSGLFATPGGSGAIALLLLDDVAIGAFQTANRFLSQTQAIKAYKVVQGA